VVVHIQYQILAHHGQAYQADVTVVHFFLLGINGRPIDQK
jgi:hypothetical protein